MFSRLALLAWLAAGATPLCAAVDYLRDVKPLLTRHCVTCHGADNAKAKLRLDTAANALRGGASGASVLAGKPGESALVQVLRGTHADIAPMPYKKPPLPSEQIHLIEEWIAAGAPVPPEEQPGVFVHWSFVPPVRPAAPTVAEVANPIDAFIRARLDGAGIRPSPPATAETQLRRVHLDLTGLPPSPEETDAFLRERSPAAYERIVEMLLASPHYGERWGRWWLDAARYADSHGYSVDAPRSIWPYRDWVVGALNDDMPFDRFVTEQLAGDLMPDASVSQRVATGFHRNTQINQEGGIDPEQFRIESVFDRVATTGTVFLGLSVGCAQCHDHKFDPVTQREYYGLFAFFNDQDEPDIEVPGLKVKTMVLAERQQPRDTRLFIKGDFTRPADAVPPITPAVLPKLSAERPRPNRLDLAQWLVAPENPLTARVAVNRIWQQYFGRGLVETENDFGTQGSAPTHPELLDWLAVEFRESGWSLKHIHRLIVMSDTYRRSSYARPDLRDSDPRNLLLARQNRLRLDAEVIRDVALAASGVLDLTVGGAPVFPPQPEGLGAFTQNKREWKASTGGQRYRRAIYTSLQRSTLHPALAVFDAPDTFTTCTRRLRSNTPLQALTLLNDAQFHEISAALAAKIAASSGTPSERIATGFRRCIGRAPARAEVERLEALRKAELDSGANEATAWLAVARVLVNLDETITRE